MIFSIIPLQYYSTVFYTVTFLLCLGYGLAYMSSDSSQKLLTQQSPLPALALAVLLSIYIGFRPISWYFGDMGFYAYEYESPNLSYAIGGTEWFFSFIRYVCRTIGLSTPQFFAVIAFLYVGLGLISCKKLLWENSMLAFLFFISAFSFWGYGTNGIRNGLASSIILYAITYGVDRKWILSLLFMYIAFAVHRSAALPAMMFLVSSFIIKKTRYAVYFWFFSIVLSLITGDRISLHLAAIGFDERMSRYVIQSAQFANQFSHTGFRWDFLLYSAVPVTISWYISEKRGIKDSTFNILANTYILSNAFWIMVIQSAFSNRFAYLSWFIYPILLAYVFIRIPLWEDQDKKAGWALLLHASFTIFMFIIGKLY